MDTWLINRKTGYLGKTSTQIGSDGGQLLLGNESAAASLRSPNLKILVV
jgi:hypothetical protein